MNKQPIGLFELWQETVDALTREGLLLCTVGADGKPNVMTIGWMSAGVIWGRPVVTVLVRPSRHSYGLLEQVGEFTVNVLPPQFDEAVQYCGGASGRDGDKFAHTSLTPAPAQKVRAPIVEQGVIHYECRVVHKNDVAPATLTPEIVAGAYPQGNFHRLYFGELLAVYAASDASEQLRSLSP
ncbi:MAG: flavin reductase family protein [Verrucomicrobiae bacterium]|nr:flavin reductase family protein [Verrucomicrobiae bacterium]